MSIQVSKDTDGAVLIILDDAERVIRVADSDASGIAYVVVEDM